jgi:hypothetical protein
MPLRLNVGVSKKLGLPNYSSIGASCNLEVELESNLIRDLDGLHAEARGGFIAAQQAVNAENRGPKPTYNLDTPAPCFPRRALARCR